MNVESRPGEAAIEARIQRLTSVYDPFSDSPTVSTFAVATAQQNALLALTAASGVVALATIGHTGASALREEAMSTWGFSS